MENDFAEHIKGPIPNKMVSSIYSTWVNPPDSLSWLHCDGCDQEVLWYDCDIVMRNLGRRKWCRNCDPVQVPYVSPLYYRQPNFGWWEGC